MEGYTKIGRIRPNYTGAWNAETAYTVLEMVKNEAGTASYIAKQDVPAGTPLTDETYWAMVLDAGDVIDSAEKAAEAANKAAQEYAELDGKFEQLSKDVDAISRLEKVNIAFDGVEDGKVYSSYAPNGSTLSGYRTYYKAVAEGQEYYIDTVVIAAASYAVCTLYRNGSYFMSVGLYPEYSGKVTDYKVTIPSGVDTLRISVTNASEVRLKQVQRVINSTASAEGKNSLYVSVVSDLLTTKSAYGDGLDITAKFGKRGVNRIPDFISFATSENANVDVDATADTTVFLNPGTDWHAPFIMRAVNNADGDMPNGYDAHFTGGNHEYTNTGSGGTATARCETLEYYVNGKKVTEYDGYADNVLVFWRNYVQGNNTKKADGTGREILIEEHRLAFDGIEWTTEVELIPIEDIIIKRWYGLQLCGLNSGNYSKIRYLNAKNRAEYDVTSSSISGNKDADGMVATGDTHCIRCEIDAMYDLGEREFYNGNQGAFALTYGKAYFFIIDGEETFAANSHYYLRGKYKFEPAF